MVCEVRKQQQPDTPRRFPMAPIARTSLGVNPRHPETPLTRHTCIFMSNRGRRQPSAPRKSKRLHGTAAYAGAPPGCALAAGSPARPRVATPSPLRRLEAPLASLGELKRRAYSRRGERGEAGSRRASGLGGRAGGRERDRRRGTSAVHPRGRAGRAVGEPAVKKMPRRHVHRSATF